MPKNATRRPVEGQRSRAGRRLETSHSPCFNAGESAPSSGRRLFSGAEDRRPRRPAVVVRRSDGPHPQCRPYWHVPAMDGGKVSRRATAPPFTRESLAGPRRPTSDPGKEKVVKTPATAAGSCRLEIDGKQRTAGMPGTLGVRRPRAGPTLEGADRQENVRRGDRFRGA